MLVKAGATKKARAKLKIHWEGSQCAFVCYAIKKTYVGGSSKTDTLGTILKWKYFRAVDPASRSPGESVNADEDVGQGDDGFSGGLVGDEPSQVGITVDLSNSVSLGGHDGSDTEMDDAAQDATSQEQSSTTNAVNEWENDSSGDQEDDVLDDGRVKRRAA